MCHSWLHVTFTSLFFCSFPRGGSQPLLCSMTMRAGAAETVTGESKEKEMFVTSFQMSPKALWQDLWTEEMSSYTRGKQKVLNSAPSAGCLESTPISFTGLCLLLCRHITAHRLKASIGANPCYIARQPRKSEGTSGRLITLCHPDSWWQEAFFSANTLIGGVIVMRHIQPYSFP